MKSSNGLPLEDFGFHFGYFFPALRGAQPQAGSAACGVVCSVYFFRLVAAQQPNSVMPAR